MNNIPSNKAFSRWFGVFGMALLCCLAQEVRAAEPIALRAPGFSRQVNFVGGWPMLSFGARWTERLRIGAHLRLLSGVDTATVSSAGVSVGTHWLLGSKPKGWSYPLHLSGGLLFPTLEPGMSLSGTASVQALYRGTRVSVAFGLALPMAVQFLPSIEARLPVLLEFWLLFRAGPTWLGLHLNGGVSFVPDQFLTPAYQVSIVIGFSLEGVLKNKRKAP